MGNCEFLKIFNRLRKSSSESIDNVEKFDSFKDYMHVTRPVELDLKNILRRINNSGRKTLVLLCGSAGDGKSHLLSFLKNSDNERLIGDYVVYNDATESNAPSKTAIDTLNELLSPFKDCNITNPGKNTILAINLGVLNNFIESEYGNEFSQLKEYVEKSNILGSSVKENDYSEYSYFQHVSFSDYHMYTLTENGPKTEYIEMLFDKVFSGNEDNVFYSTYRKECSLCPFSQKCPVKMNYEFMMKKTHQVYISELLVKSVVCDKVVLTTREILNFIYDIIVSHEFNIAKLAKMIDDTVYLKAFIAQTTPSLVFESSDVTPLMNLIKKYDPLLIRTEQADEIAISYYVSSNIEKDAKNVLQLEAYDGTVCNQLDKIKSDKVLKAQLFSFVVRIREMGAGESNSLYKDYLRDLYYYNAGKEKKLSKLYSMMERAVVQWCGSDIDGNLCLDDRHRGFIVFENIKFEPNLDHIPHPDYDEELQKFIPYITVSFEDSMNENILLDIDYSLYTMIYKLNNGYLQTANDRNSHADFIGFVDRLLMTGSLKEMIMIASDNGKRASLSRGKFGYKFKVMR